MKRVNTQEAFKRHYGSAKTLKEIVRLSMKKTSRVRYIR